MGPGGCGQQQGWGSRQGHPAQTWPGPGAPSPPRGQESSVDKSPDSRATNTRGHAQVSLLRPSVLVSRWLRTNTCFVGRKVRAEHSPGDQALRAGGMPGQAGTEQGSETMYHTPPRPGVPLPSCPGLTPDPKGSPEPQGLPMGRETDGGGQHCRGRASQNPPHPPCVRGPFVPTLLPSPPPLPSACPQGSRSPSCQVCSRDAPICCESEGGVHRAPRWLWGCRAC